MNSGTEAFEPVLLDITKIVRRYEAGGDSGNMALIVNQPIEYSTTPHPLESPGVGMLVIDKSFLLCISKLN